MGVNFRGMSVEPYALVATAAGGAANSPSVSGALYEVRLTYSGADGSTTAAIAIVNGTDVHTVETVTGNTAKTVFPRGTANDGSGGDVTGANTEVYLLANEVIRLTVTGNGTVTATVKLLV